MSNFFRHLLGLEPKVTSRKAANDRLRIVLSHDRLDASSRLLETIKEEIIEVICRHVEVDGPPDIHFVTASRHSTLDISVPIKRR